MGIIPEETVKEAEAEIEKVRETKALNPGGVMTDPMALAAMEQMGKEVQKRIDEAVEAARPKAIDAEAVEVGDAPYAGSSMEFADGFEGAGGGADPWAAGADSPFAQ